MKSLQNKNLRSAVLFAVCFALASAASAAPGTAGGLTTATTTAATIQTALFAFIGGCSGIYLLYTGVMAWSDKKTWGDFGMAIVHVSLVGGAVALANWAWALFQ